MFTAGTGDRAPYDSVEIHRSVSYVVDLSLGELVLLNALRLRMRTLRYVNIASQTVPMLRESLALPPIESLLDAILVESLQYSAEAPDIRCLCSQVVSVGESRFLAAISSFATGDAELIASKLCDWFPASSVERLRARTDEFQFTVVNLGAAVPRRDWKENELSNRLDQPDACEHVTAPAMIH